MGSSLSKPLLRFDSLLLPSIEQWLELFNDKRVQKHMPLASDSVDAIWVENWVRHKFDDSQNSPFKVYSVWLDENFAGWAAIQKDEEDYELAIVLNPTYWGAGLNVFQKLVKDFVDSKINQSLYVYLPPTRNTKNITKKFKLKEIGFIEIHKVQFTKLLVNVGGEGFVIPF